LKIENKESSMKSKEEGLEEMGRKINSIQCRKE
jgi:hypothetical protein